MHVINVFPLKISEQKNRTRESVEKICKTEDFEIRKLQHDLVEIYAAISILRCGLDFIFDFMFGSNFFLLFLGRNLWFDFRSKFLLLFLSPNL